MFLIYSVLTIPLPPQKKTQQTMNWLARERKQYIANLQTSLTTYFATKQTLLHFYPHKFKKMVRKMGEKCIDPKIINAKN